LAIFNQWGNISVILGARYLEGVVMVRRWVNLVGVTPLLLGMMVASDEKNFQLQ
jgi:hypothetical protein